MVQGSTLPPAVELARARTIFGDALRALPCGNSRTEPGFGAPPNGVMLETVGQIMAHLPEVTQRAARTMPMGNVTGMTDQERETLLMWIGHGGLQ